MRTGGVVEVCMVYCMVGMVGEHRHDKKYMSRHLQDECDKETAGYLRLRKAESLIDFSI